MRTTLTLDDDVAARLEQLRKARNLSLRELVNDALRTGLTSLEGRREPRGQPYKMPDTLSSKPLVPNVDSISATLAHGEGEDYA